MTEAYSGTELALFAGAANWKSYWTGLARPYLGRSVIEVGAGLGANTAYLAERGEWTLLEPDPTMAARLAGLHAHDKGPVRYRIVEGTLASLPPLPRADTIIYADVLEHIADDRAELALASERLERGGHLIVLAPAHGFLFSPFDQAIGHFRRYDRASLEAAVPPGFTQRRLVYLDSLGLVLSLANRLVLRSPVPSRSQIETWDRLVVPASRILDPLSRHGIGKSVLGIWRKG